MSNATKFLLLAFGLALTCLLIVYFSRVKDVGFDTSEVAAKKLTDFNRELSESDITMYEGLEVVGSDVVNFIKKNIGSYGVGEEAPMYVKVSTAKSVTTYKNGASLPEIQDFSSTLYIKPIAKFSCKIIRDDNDMIVGINFEQS